MVVMEYVVISQPILFCNISETKFPGYSTYVCHYGYNNYSKIYIYSGLYGTDMKYRPQVPIPGCQGLSTRLHWLFFQYAKYSPKRSPCPAPHITSPIVKHSLINCTKILHRVNLASLWYILKKTANNTLEEFIRRYFPCEAFFANPRACALGWC